MRHGCGNAARRLACLGVLAFAVCAPALAQRNVPPPGRAPFVFHANVGEVLLHVTVFDKKRQSVEGLPKSDFSVFENGVRQRVDYFANDDAPVSVGILIDNSGSMSGLRSEVDKAALNFVRAGNAGDQEFIVNFNDEYYLDAPFTNRLSILQKGLEQIQSRGGTALYDAILASLTYMNANATEQKHVFLVVTDGDDNASRYTLEQTLRILQSGNPPLIYCIGLLDHDDTRSMRNSAERALRALARATGGLAYFPKDLAQVNAITQEVAREIRSQYTLSYHSNQAGAGYRSIRVEVRDPKRKDLRVRARAGYYQPAAASAQNAP